MIGRGWELPFRPFGVPVSLDPSFALVLPLFAWMIGSQVGPFAELFAQLGIDLDPDTLTRGFTPPLLGLSAALGLFLSVLVHEFGHALTARRYRVRTLRITLWFLGGVAQFDDIPRQRGAEAVVAIAGPITSALLSGGMWLLLRSDLLVGGVAFVAAYLMFTNAALAIFNLLPALPLDGGRVLRSLLAWGTNPRLATRVSAVIGRLVAILLGVYGFLTLQIFLVAIAFFIDAAGRAEVAASNARLAFEGRRVREAMTPDPVTIDLGWTLEQARRLRSFRRHTAYPVLDLAGQPIGWLRGSDLDDPATPSLAAVLVALETVAADAHLEDAVRQLGEAAAGRLLVTNRDGSVVGVLGKADVVRWLQRSDT
jgi:Zn-dependent protease